ncbi:TolB family protein [Tahibacter harae]|uniref:WD40 repeat protein n=1 Tax=Tahibacter harae TaxID=2963937 RepID=A0ABT1QXJ3_9GAMM|nr:hypothetical protein [Tahibacter harae]MCQ4167009.1 hypothetical protein [Tahibacter harae]
MRNLKSGILASAICLQLALPAAQAATLEVVNRTAIAAPIDADGGSASAFAVTHDGRYTLFFSAASNLVAGDSNGLNDLFIHDHLSGSNERVNVSSSGEQANAEGGLVGAGLSDDGRYVVFQSYATNLVPGVDSGAPHVYLRDRQAGTTTVVARTPGGADGAQISADGRFIVFSTDDALVPADTNRYTDVYRVERASGKTELVSLTERGESAVGFNYWAQLSDDGRYVLFTSEAFGMLEESPWPGNLLLRDMELDTLEAVNRSYAGAVITGGHELPAGRAFSSDGRYVVFNSASALDPADTNLAVDGYRYDRMLRTTERVTRSPISPLLPGGARVLGLSGDGDMLLLDSAAGGLVAGVGPGKLRNYLRDIGSGEVSVIKLRPGAFDPADQVAGCTLAGNRRSLYCQSYDQGITRDDHNGLSDIFYSNVGRDGVERVSRPYSRTPVAAANNHSRAGAASADGRYVVFSSEASNLVVGDYNGVADVFLRDRLTATTTRLSLDSAGNEAYCASAAPQITPDGQTVLFQSCGDLLPAANGKVQVYRYHLASRQLQLASRDAAGAPCAADCSLLDASADGATVLFLSSAANLGGGTLPAAGGLFVRDVDSGVPVLVNRALQGGVADCRVSAARLSGDARTVYFSDCSNNLVAGDTNYVDDIFAFNRASASLQRISLDNAGAQLPSGARLYGVSQDGSLLLMAAPEFLCNGYSGFQLRDMASGQSRCISDSSQHPAGGWADLSADGRRAAFTVRDDSGPFRYRQNIFAYDVASQQAQRVTRADSFADSERLRLCPGGECVLFDSHAANLVPGDGNGGFADVFLATDLFGDSPVPATPASRP